MTGSPESSVPVQLSCESAVFDALTALPRGHRTRPHRVRRLLHTAQDVWLALRIRLS